MNALGEVEKFVLGGAQLFDDLVDARGLELGNAQPGLADVLFDPGDLRQVAASAADDLGFAALQGEQPGLAFQALLKQHQHGVGFLTDEPQLEVLGADLTLEADDLLVELGNALAEHRDLAGQGLAPGVEDAALAVDHGDHLGVGEFGQQPVREHHRVEAVALGGQPRLEGGGGAAAAAQQAQGGAGLGIVEPEQHLAGNHLVAVPNQDLADDAAFEMLHGLALARDADHAGRDGGAFQGRHGRPAAEAAEEQGQDHQAGGHRAGDAEAAAFGRDGVAEAGGGGLRGGHCPSPKDS